MTPLDQPALPAAGAARTAILVLLALTAVMLLALLTRTPPHPPVEVAPFALGPFLGASLAIGVAAYRTSRDGSRVADALTLLFVVTALVSFGPQKLVDPAFDRIWPTVVTAQAAIVAILVEFTRKRRRVRRG